MYKEFAHFYCPGPHPGIERFKACIVQRRFPEHFHEGYVFGVIQGGNQLLVINGESYAAPAGSLIFLKPYDLHAVSSADSSAVVYQTLHVPPSLMTELVTHGLDARQPVVHAPHWAVQIADAFEQLDQCTNPQKWNKMFMGMLRVLSPVLQLPATPRSSGTACIAHDVLSLIHELNPCGRWCIHWHRHGWAAFFCKLSDRTCHHDRPLPVIQSMGHIRWRGVSDLHCSTHRPVCTQAGAGVHQHTIAKDHPRQFLACMANRRSDKHHQHEDHCLHDQHICEIPGCRAIFDREGHGHCDLQRL